MSRIRLLLASLTACAALGCSLLTTMPPAYASHNQMMLFEAPGELLNPATRAHAIGQLQELGVHAIRVEMPWWAVAPSPNARTAPRFDARNPASYDWGAYESLLDEAHALGWQVLLTVSSPVPRWATSNKRRPYVTRPDDRDFEEFMTAVATRFRPDVSFFAIWNEPNEADFLKPQFNAQGQPEAGRVYRGLYQAGVKGLKASGLAKPKVLLGETSPDGFGGVTKTQKHIPRNAGVAPIAFLRNLLCLNRTYRRARTCGSLPAYGYSVHPYTAPIGPYFKPKNREDVTIGTLGRLISSLNRAAKAGAIRAGLPVFLTEFGIRSKPERYNGVAPAKQAEYDAIAEHIAWNNPRVVSFSQYLLEDDTLGSGPQTGLEYLHGRKKPLYRGFPLPLTVTHAGHAYNLWGLVRPATKSTTVTVLAQHRAGGRFTVLRKVHTGASGYWKLRSPTKALYWRVRWVSPEGVRYEGPPIKALPAL